MERQQKKDAIRDKIIAATFDLICERTWESVSSDEICAAAKVSKRTLYAYFRSQDEIYLELVKRSFAQMATCLGAAFSEGNTVTDRIINLGEAYLRFMLDEPVKGALVVRFDEMRFTESYPEQVKWIGEIANANELLALFRQQKLDPEHFDRSLALGLWAHIQGLAQLIVSKKMWLEDYYGIAIENLIAEQMTFVRKILEGLGK